MPVCVCGMSVAVCRTPKKPGVRGSHSLSEEVAQWRMKFFGIRNRKAHTQLPPNEAKFKQGRRAI